MSTNNRTAGFTLIEVLVIAPVVILAIGGFVALMVSMASDMLVTRDQNNMVYEIQDTLDRIEQDTRLSTQFLVTSGTFTAPQGSDNNFTGTAAFTNTTSTLILGGLATDKNPVDSSRQLVFYNGQPNVCGALQNYNRPFQQKIMYFIKNGSLWRRAVLPDWNTNATLDDNTVCVAPWQRNTCSPGYSPATRCQTHDTELLKNVDAFTIKYFSSPDSTTDIGAAQALAATTIEVNVSGKKVTAGRDVMSSGTMRATKLNSIDVDIPAPGTPTVTAQVSDSTSVTFSWPKVPLASSYLISYNINGGATVNATTNSQTTSYNVGANLGDTVTMQVSARNSTGVSSPAQVAMTIPAYTGCNLQNGWQNWGAEFANAGYTKTTAGVVLLTGVIRNGNAAPGTVLCTLPVGYRPSHTLIFVTDSGANPSRIDISPAGLVMVVAGSSGWISLDGIKFLPSTTSYTWTPASFVNGWSNYGGSYAPLTSTLDSVGRVHIQGLTKGTNFADNTGVTTDLPVAHQSTEYLHLPASSETPFNETGIANDIRAKGIGGTANYYSLQAMYYPSYAGWSNLNLVNGWTYLGGVFTVPQYIKSSDKVVSLKGLVRNGNTAGGTVIANLPPGYRPKGRLDFITASNGAFSRVDVLSNGDVIVVYGVSSAWLALESINFIAEQ